VSRVRAARANRRRAEARGVLGAPRLRWSPRPECLLGMGYCRIWGAAAPELLAPYDSRHRSVVLTLLSAFLTLEGCGHLGPVCRRRSNRGLRPDSHEGNGADCPRPPGGQPANRVNCAFAGVGRRRPHHRVYLTPVLRVVSTHDPCDESLCSRKICGRASLFFYPAVVTWPPVRLVRRRPRCRVLAARCFR
jgi:hypothetical protein